MITSISALEDSRTIPKPLLPGAFEDVSITIAIDSLSMQIIFAETSFVYIFVGKSQYPDAVLHTAAPVAFIGSSRQEIIASVAINFILYETPAVLLTALIEILPPSAFYAFLHFTFVNVSVTISHKVFPLPSTDLFNLFMVIVFLSFICFIDPSLLILPFDFLLNGWLNCPVGKCCLNEIGYETKCKLSFLVGFIKVSDFLRIPLLLHLMIGRLLHSGFCRRQPESRFIIEIAVLKELFPEGLKLLIAHFFSHFKNLLVKQHTALVRHQQVYQSVVWPKESIENGIRLLHKIID